VQLEPISWSERNDKERGRYVVAGVEDIIVFIVDVSVKLSETSGHFVVRGWK